ncbi:MAG TPA: ribonuclease HII [Thermomicrobiales bacterium]|nr:ribonuclease HII [Thermomicrobiales bacterium]
MRHEAALWAAGWSRVAGVDEVGRGALAGPLVAAAVVLPMRAPRQRAGLARALAGVRDSKCLTPERREALFEPIVAAASAVGVGRVEVDELDAVGLGPANRLAMERAVFALGLDADALLLDACVLDLGLPQIGLIDGDAHVLSIAAASIVAKVTRDRLMRELDAADNRYGFAQHKGYGSALHFARLAQFGPCRHHRRCFAPVAACGAERCDDA